MCKISEECLCKPEEILIFPCSGGSNVGQIANQAAVQLTEGGTGKMFCLAGIGAHLETIIEATKTAKIIVAVDGCSAECAKKTLEHAGIDVTDHIDVTKEGVAKNYSLKLSQSDIQLIVQRIKQGLKK